MAVIVYLPQRFQLQNGYSAIDAGVRMLAYLLFSSFSAGVAAVLMVIKNVIYYMLVFAVCLQVLGLGLLSTLPATEHLATRQYGYQVILGFGFGISLSVLPLMARMEVSRADHGMT